MPSIQTCTASLDRREPPCFCPAITVCTADTAVAQSHPLPVHLGGLFPVLVERHQRLLVPGDLGLDLADPLAVAMGLAAGQLLLEVLDARLVLEDFVFQVGDLAIGKTPLPARRFLLGLGRRRAAAARLLGDGLRRLAAGSEADRPRSFPRSLAAGRPSRIMQVIGHAIDEVAIVADEQHGAVELQQGPLQGVAGPEIQVVGGLVEDEEIGVGGGQPGQGRPATLAAAEACPPSARPCRRSSRSGPTGRGAAGR